jgi:hypothetical protein
MADRKHDPEPTRQVIPTKKGKPLVVPVPTRGDFDRLVKKVAGPPGVRKRSAGKDQPPKQSQ